MSQAEYDAFIDAMSDYKETRDEWRCRSDRDGFYDPCGDAERRAKAEIEAKFKRMDTAFRALVDSAVEEGR